MGGGGGQAEAAAAERRDEASLGFLSSLPRTTCIFSFMGYGFCSSG